MNKTRKKRIKRYISWVVLVAVVVWLAFMPIIAQSDVEPEGPVASILSGTVETGSIDTVLHGGGTLSEEAGVEITIPAGVKLTRFLVSNGDTVTEGQPLAEVDLVSVMSAVTGVQETLAYLLDEMKDAAGADAKDQITAEGGGRVKLVYAQPGDDVVDVILEHGALAVLSLDGMMAVSLEADTGYSAGDSLTVTLSDGTRIPGWVESNLDGILTITVEDTGYKVGETVTVEDLGSGKLYIHNAWNATAFSGTIKSVAIKEEDTVSPGRTIMTLSDVNSNAAFEVLRAQHQEYEELMLELFRLYQSATITAPCDGVVSGIDDNSIHLLSGSNGNYVLTLLSNAPGADPDAGYSNYVGQITGVLGSTWTVRLNPVQQQVRDYIADLGNVDQSTENMVITAEQEMVTVYKLVDGQWEISEAAVGDILLFALDGNGCVWAVHVGSPEETPTEPVEPTEPPEDPTLPDDPGTEPTVPDDPVTDPTFPNIPGFPDFPNIPQFPTGGFAGYGGSAAQEPEFERYSLDDSTIMEITAQDTMTLTITVDEQDLHKVSLGQTAEVAIPALKGQRFSATLTHISTKATNNGGSSKFAVELTLDRAENMLDGMSATATIILSTTSDILTVPLAALEEQGSKTIIYTGYDVNSGTLINPVTVTIGIADAHSAQILSGLDLGATYYYAYYDTLEISPDVEHNGFGFH